MLLICYINEALYSKKEIVFLIHIHPYPFFTVEDNFIFYILILEFQLAIL